jgi:hypothetical protein
MCMHRRCFAHRNVWLAIDIDIRTCARAAVDMIGHGTIVPIAEMTRADGESVCLSYCLSVCLSSCLPACIQIACLSVCLSWNEKWSFSPLHFQKIRCLHTCIHACMHTYIHTYIHTPHRRHGSGEHPQRAAHSHPGRRTHQHIHTAASFKLASGHPNRSAVLRSLLA